MVSPIAGARAVLRSRHSIAAHGLGPQPRAAARARVRAVAAGSALLHALTAAAITGGPVEPGAPLAPHAARAAVATRADAQPPPPTAATATTAPVATGTPIPAPDITGTWSITRSWLRACPACSRPVVRTTTWRIDVAGSDVAVQRGPRGTIRPDGAGGGLLDLDGLESEGDLVLRLAYATLRVEPDGRSFEGAFGGSERGPNPCGDEPQVVTCFASAGWLRAVRLGGPPTPSPTATGSAPGPPTPPAASSPTPTTAPTLSPPTAAPSPTASASAAAPTPTTTWPWRRFAPSAARP